MLSRLLLNERDQLTKDDAITIARVERSVPTLVAGAILSEVDPENETVG